MFSGARIISAIDFEAYTADNGHSKQTPICNGSHDHDVLIRTTDVFPGKDEYSSACSLVSGVFQICVPDLARFLVEAGNMKVLQNSITSKKLFQIIPVPIAWEQDSTGEYVVTMQMQLNI